MAHDAPITQVTVHAPPLPIPYGTHHSKFFVLVYAAGLRLIVHTANLVFPDCNDKTQGLYFQDFPPKSPADGDEQTPDFEVVLLRYLEALRLPARDWQNLSVAVSRHDFSSARVALVPSTPGRHVGSALHHHGHMRVRDILAHSVFPARFKGAPLCAQFSSFGSLTEGWLHGEFASSLSAGSVTDALTGGAPPSAHLCSYSSIFSELGPRPRLLEVSLAVQ